MSKIHLIFRKRVLTIQIIQRILLLFLLVPLMAQVDYDSEIQPIFNSRCTNCHSGSDAEEGLNLSSYNNVMNGGDSGDVVIPYDHANSLLWQYINSGFMPPGNNDLTGTQVDLISQWIDEGALPNVPDCDPELMCGQAITCCDGLLYPTTCCDANCNESIGECGDILSGDVNGDGILNVLDVVLMVNLALDGEFEDEADMNGDGIINVLDIVTLINTILS